MSRSDLSNLFPCFATGWLVVSLFAGTAGCQKTDDLLEPSPEDNTILHATYRSAEAFRRDPIVMDGQMIDREWGGEAVPFLNVRVSSENGAGHVARPAYVSMKAVYTDRDLFLLVRWVDPRPDQLRDATVYTGPDLDQLGRGCRPELLDEANWTRNPGNAYQEDQLAIAFEIDSVGGAIGTFREHGCLVLCHAQEQPGFGRPDFGRIDLWQWMAARTNPVRDLFDPTDNPNNSLYGIAGYLDDLVAVPSAGLGPDPGTPSFVPNFVPGSDLPLHVYRPSEPDDPYANPREPNQCVNQFGEKCRKNNGVSLAYIWRDFVQVAVPRFGACDTINHAPLPLGTEPHKWEPGDLVSGWILTYPSGSRADIHGRAGFENGVWTLEIGRRLNTGDPVHDVVFRPASGRAYAFTIATMDNSASEQRGSETQYLVFDPKPVRR